MHQRSSHEPRYKQSTRARELRHAESNEYSEVSSSSEEEEESSDRCTEETEENSVVSRECQSYQESLQDLDRGGRPSKQASYMPVLGGSKKDKFTQKNLLSPFPSYWAPPEKKEFLGNTYYKVSKIMPITGKRYSFQAGEKSPKSSSKKRESYEGNDGLAKKSPNTSEKKLEKHRSEKESQSLKIIQSKQTGRYDRRETSGKLLAPLVEDLTRNFGEKGTSRRPRTCHEIEFSNKMSENCPDCIAAAAKLKRKSGVGTTSKEKGQTSRDIDLSKDIGDGKPVKNKGKEVKEKLVYVVEEEGKDATKIETDIFSLSEILAIKKDLIELSEFAKKLKKVKEMKKDSESEQNKKNFCHCHPAEELLRDVNKRIEALEARQEELERKSQSSNRTTDRKAPSKKMVKPKTSVSQPKTPVLVNLSAATTVPSDPRTEILETRVEGFACNSDIFNELMDIKTQLEKLEKKRMLKEVSNETGFQKKTSLTKAKDHAIAVFSSKTYIITTENFDKTKSGKAIGEKSARELTKENVVNWLKSVSLERTNNDVSVFLSPNAKKEESSPNQKKREEGFRREKCIQISKRKDFENQEPQKNRASENLERGVDMSITCFVKNQYAEEPSQFLEHKRCVVTSSGRFVPLVSERKENLKNIPRKESDPHHPDVSSLQRKLPKIVHRSASNGSIPSTILIKRHLKKLKSHLTRKKHRNEMRIIRSRSATTTISKREKDAENQKTKNSSFGTESPSSSSKKPKEGKKEFLKRLEAQFMTLAKNLGMVDPSTTSYSYSELLATVDLEASNSKKWLQNPNDNQFMVYSATNKKGNESSINRRYFHQDKLKKDCHSKKSYNSECKKVRKRRNMEEKCKRLQKNINEKRVPKHKRQSTPECKKRIKKKKKKKPKPRHHHHAHHPHCRSSLLLHPWHPPCKIKDEKEECVLEDEEDVSEEERNTHSSTSENSSSEGTRECISFADEPTPPKCHSRPSIIKSRSHVDRCHKLKRKTSGSTNFDRGFFKKFFKKIGRCYPLFSDKEIIAPRKYCATKRRCSESESGSEEKCCHPESGTSSKRSIRCQPSHGTQHRRTLHFHVKHPHGFQHHTSPRHPRHHSQDSQHHCTQSRRTPHHTRKQYPCEPHPKRVQGLRHHKTSHVGRCECEFVKPFTEYKDLSSLSSFKPFELLEDENKSKMTLKTKKPNKNDCEYPKLNHQVFLVNSVTDDFGKENQGLSCFCSKCGNVHRRQNKFVYTLIDQKAVSRKLKRPLRGHTVPEKFEDESRGQYDNYDDCNFHQCDSHDSHHKSNKLVKKGPKSDQYDDLRYCPKGSDCEVYKVNSKKSHYKDHKVGYHTDSSPRCCDSIKSRDSSKKGEIFPFFSFFRQICRLKPKKSEENRKTTGCQCKEKFDRLEMRMDEMEKGLFSRRKKTSKSRKSSPKRHKSRSTRGRRSKRFNKEEKKLEKEFQNSTRAQKKRDEIERKSRKRRHKDLKKLKKLEALEENFSEAPVVYYTMNTPSLIPSTSLSTQGKKLFQAKSSFQFQKIVNDGLSSLHSCWLNLRNHKFNSLRNLLNKMRRKSVTDSNFLLDDSSRSSQNPRKKQVFEPTNEPNSFLETHVKSRKKEKRKQKEKASPKSRSMRERHR